MKKTFKKLLPIIDVIIALPLIPAAWLLKKVRQIGVEYLPISKKLLFKIGVFPIINHYFEPQYQVNEDQIGLTKERNLPGINLNVDVQLNLLSHFGYNKELEDLPNDKTDDSTYYLGNNAFKSGDAEYWYQLIRHKKPQHIIEIGSGYSTLIAIKALEKNTDDLPDYNCEHICIEPYQRPWLEQSNVSVIREKVEDLDVSFFSNLGENDILFIDSSHVIRPHGDVLFEYLEILPVLNSGVIVHIHDIFTPRNYIEDFLISKVRFWNEQYLLEAFLSNNSNWKIIGALNYLHHNYYDKIKEVCPHLTPSREPGSFYIQKI